ncbi:MAG TPA: LemA family protein [Rhodanobacteraceae bacterium]|nr:LemA family protein [Rhodanobacteraceae bacterium]
MMAPVFPRGWESVALPTGTVGGHRQPRHGTYGVLIAALALVFAAAIAWLFNRLVRLRNQVRVAWSDVDVQLQRRHDLVPPLVQTVKAYATHESGLLDRVAGERRAALSATSTPERETSEAALGQSLSRLIALAESYPDLKASDNFMQLSRQLVETEDLIQHARRFYNGSVRQYNTAIERFPTVVLARLLGFRPAGFFAADEDARAPVPVGLG